MFVTCRISSEAAINIRAHTNLPQIPFQSVISLKTVLEMAGNIIPAIATTNAIISGLIVLQALQLLRKAYGAMKTVMIQYKQTNPLSSVTLSPPNPSCGVSRHVRGGAVRSEQNGVANG